MIAMALPLAAQPKLTIDKDSQYDWGVVRPSQSPIKTEFKLSNTGSNTLIIRKLEPDCSCTTTPLDKDTIEPGEYATLKVEIKLSEKEGTMKKRVKVFTNIEGADSMKIIMMSATVVPPLSFFPKRIFNFGMVEIGKEATSKIVVTNETQKNITVKNVRGSQYVTLDLKDNQVLKPGEDITITAVLKSVKSGNFSDLITFETDDPDTPSVKMYATGTVVGPVKGPDTGTKPGK